MRERKTDLGKVLYALRVEHEENVWDMASRVGCAASDLSSIELGRKPASMDFIETMIKAYQLDDVAADAMRAAADHARAHYSLRPVSPAARNMVGILARKLDTLTPDQVQDIKGILNRS